MIYAGKNLQQKLSLKNWTMKNYVCLMGWVVGGGCMGVAHAILCQLAPAPSEMSLRTCYDGIVNENFPSLPKVSLWWVVITKHKVVSCG